jgi:hypothetical protein
MAYSDEHEPPELISELVASITAMVDEIVVGFEDAIGEPLWLQSGRSADTRSGKSQKGAQRCWHSGRVGYIVKILYLAA